jgi:hypothetical protein
MAAACYWLGRKFYPIPYGVGKSLVYIISTVILIYAVNVIQIDVQWLAFSFHSIILIVWVGFVYWIERKYLIMPTS